MALIKVGSMNNFAVTANEGAKSEMPFLKRINTFSALKEISRTFPPGSFELITSKDKRGIGLNSLTLTEGFEGFMQKFLHPDDDICFIAWVWDLSGKPVSQYPCAPADCLDVIIPVRAGNLREFTGHGTELFPKRKVTGGMAVRIQLWESDQQERDFGKLLSDTAAAIQTSELNNLLSQVSLTKRVTGTAITLIREASDGLAGLIGTILQKNGDDCVDFFEGYYAADQKWVPGTETYQGNASVVTLNKY